MRATRPGLFPVREASHGLAQELEMFVAADPVKLVRLRAQFRN